MDRLAEQRPGADERAATVIEFDDPNTVVVDASGDVAVRGRRVTRAGGWLRIGSSDERIPGVLRWIAVHLRVERHGAKSSVVIDRVRFGDVEWDDIGRFLDVFDGVWSPHLVEQTRRVLERGSERRSAAR